MLDQSSLLKLGFDMRKICFVMTTSERQEQAMRAKLCVQHFKPCKNSILSSTLRR